MQLRLFAFSDFWFLVCCFLVAADSVSRSHLRLHSPTLVNSINNAVAPRALDLKIVALNPAARSGIVATDAYSVRLETSVNRFVLPLSCSNAGKPAEAQVVVDLYGMLHVADSAFYEAITKRMQQYDIVLYELITSRANIELVDGIPLKRRLDTEVMSKSTQALAERFGLHEQLSLDLLQNNWFIADLDSETVQTLEQIPRASAAIFGSEKKYPRLYDELMKRFFVGDELFVLLLRALSWLTPCPELSYLLLDWSRMSPFAGGFTSLIVPILDHLAAGNLRAASKLAFAQQLVSGVPFNGAFGGEEGSNVDVRIKARNRACLRTLDYFIDEYRSTLIKCNKDQVDGDDFCDGKEFKVGILYGAYHINDLIERLTQDMGFHTCVAPSTFRNYKMDSDSDAVDATEVVSSDAASGQLQGTLTCWEIWSPAMTKILDGTNSVTYSSISGDTLLRLQPVKIIVLSAAFVLYLVMGALQWWLTWDLLANALERVLYEEDLRKLATDGDRDGGALESIVLAVSWLLLYVQLHLWQLRQISYAGIQWDRGLFTESSHK